MRVVEAMITLKNHPNQQSGKFYKRRDVPSRKAWKTKKTVKVDDCTIPGKGHFGLFLLLAKAFICILTTL